MSSDVRTGRHRAATRYSPVAEFSALARSASQTGVRASAVLAASGGLVATLALPATASATASARVATETSGSSSASPRVAELPRALLAAPAVTAPRAAAPVATHLVGVAGVKAVAKPKPKPKPKPVPAPVQQAVQERSTSTGTASRSETRTPVREVPQGVSGVVDIARSLLGIPYSYGGSSPSGFDCSGFTMYVFGKAGTSLPRTAAQQQSAATPVSDPQPGDLVFFGSPAWHVGIYTGSGMMVDSGKPGEVTQERAVFSGVSGYGRF